MLIEFSVKNFLSFKDKVTLSMVPFASYKEHQDTNITETGGTKIPRVLNSAVIFGPNGSGKTNLFKAMEHLRLMVLFSHAKDDLIPKIAPHALSEKADSTDFTIVFLEDKFIYKFSISIASSRIVYEKLEVMTNDPQQRLSPLYERKGDEVTFGTKMKGDKKSIFEKTRPTTLYLSALKQWNNPIAENPFRWVNEKLVTIVNFSANEETMLAYTLRQVKEQSGKDANILEIMSAADTGVVSLDIHRYDEEQSIPSEGVFEKIQNILQEEHRDIKVERKPSHRWKVGFVHQYQSKGGIEGTFSVGIQLESNGTRKLFAITAPLLDVLEKGSILVIDELDASLHPHLTACIISLFNDPDINTKGAQLIFNTHDIVLMDPELFRRDQIWFTEKGADGGSTLTPLLDYSPRNNEPLGANYLAGVYNAIPFIQDKFFIKRENKTDGTKKT